MAGDRCRGEYAVRWREVFTGACLGYSNRSILPCRCTRAAGCFNTSLTIQLICIITVEVILGRMQLVCKSGNTCGQCFPVCKGAFRRGHNKQDNIKLQQNLLCLQCVAALGSEHKCYRGFIGYVW